MCDKTLNFPTPIRTDYVTETSLDIAWFSHTKVIEMPFSHCSWAGDVRTVYCNHRLPNNHRSTGSNSNCSEFQLKWLIMCHRDTQKSQKKLRDACNLLFGSNIGFTLSRVLALFKRSAIPFPKINRFEWNLEHSEYIAGGWPWLILGAIRALATAREPGENCFCQVSNAFHRFSEIWIQLIGRCRD